jgi:hypothetical protein
MPISTARYTEVRFAIDDLVQRENWKSLFELFGTSDDEQSRMMATIASNYDPKKIWRFVDYVTQMPLNERTSRPDSVTTVCYVLGKMGQSNTKRTLNCLRKFLSEDHVIRASVMASLSNLWVLDTSVTSNVLLKSWILGNKEDDELQEAAIRSCEFIAKKDPARVVKFLLPIVKMTERKPAFKVAKEIFSKSIPQSLQVGTEKSSVKKRKENNEKRRKRKGKKKRK